MATFWAGDRCVDTHERTVSVAGEDSVELTETEALFLDFLFRRPGETVAKDTLLQEVWGYRPGVRSRTVDTTLARLRQKLEPVPAEPRFLRTRRGFGIVIQGVSSAPGPSAARVRVRYPKVPGQLVGRGKELEALEALATTGGGIQLVGPDGVGRTALALAWLDAHNDGATSVLFVDTLGLSTGLGARGALAEVLGVESAGADDLARAMAELGRVLWVVANVDELPRSLLETWSRLGAAVVFTARRRLDLDGPCLPVGPLSSVGTVELVEQTARTRGITLSPATVERLAELSGGLPLAVELLAPVVQLLGDEAVPAWAMALEGTDARGRSRRLDASLQASWDELGSDERHVLACGARLEGPFDLAVLAAVSGRDPARVMRCLSTLVDRSLVHTDGSGLRILSPTRRFASQRLDVAEEVDERILAWFVAQHDELATRQPAALAPRKRDLLRLLPSANRSLHVPLLELVFLGGWRGGWMAEALDGLEGMLPLLDGDVAALARALAMQLRWVVVGDWDERADELPADVEGLARWERVHWGLRLARSGGAEACGRYLEQVPLDADPLMGMVRTSVLGRIARSDAGRPHLQALAQHAAAEGWTTVQRGARGLYALTLAGDGAVDEALALLDGLDDDTPDGSAFQRRMRALVLCDGGRWDEARVAVQRLYRTASDAGLRQQMLAAWVVGVCLAWLQGDDAEALHLLARHEGEDVGPRGPLAALVRARLEDRAPPADLPEPLASMVDDVRSGRDPRSRVEVGDSLARVVAEALARRGWGAEPTSS